MNKMNKKTKNVKKTKTVEKPRTKIKNCHKRTNKTMTKSSLTRRLTKCRKEMTKLQPGSLPALHPLLLPKAARP